MTTTHQRSNDTRLFLGTIVCVLVLVLALTVWRSTLAGWFGNRWYASTAVIQLQPVKKHWHGNTQAAMPAYEDVISQPHEKAIQSVRLIDDCLNEHENLLKHNTFAELNRQEAMQLIQENLTVTTDPEDSHLVTLRFRAKDPNDAKRVLDYLIQTYRDHVSNEWRDALNEYRDHIRTVYAECHDRRSQVEIKIAEVRATLGKKPMLEESMRIFLKQLHEARARLNEKQQRQSMITDCLETNDAEALKQTRWILTQWGEASVESDMPAATMLDHVSSKLSTEMLWLEERIERLQEQIREHEARALEQMQIEWELDQLMQHYYAINELCFLAWQKRTELELHEPIIGAYFELLTRPEKGTRVR